MKHLCHAMGCKRTCAPKYLMCPPHWEQVPRVIQHQVQRSFSPAQCKPGAKVKPSLLWFAAARAAINAVAVAEGHIPEALLVAALQRMVAAIKEEAATAE